MTVAATVFRETRYLPGTSVNGKRFGVYVHIPFCARRCHYCDFNTYEGLDAIHGAYIDALVADIKRSTECRPATSVFFGGGTPTLLGADALKRILDAIRGTTGLAPNCEITVEANPETVDERKFAALLEAGFNRVSIGVQTLVPHVLQGLGRTHSAERALEAIAAARHAGFTNLNVDLIYGSQWESAQDWLTTLEGVVAVGPDHVSAYALTIEEGTPLGTWVATGRLRDVDPDIQAERHSIANEILGAAGYTRYEVSNWARPDRTCRHNLLYWSAGDYLGFGAGAHGHVSGHRYWNVRLPRNFITRVGQSMTTIVGEESLDLDQRAGEALMLGLRLRDGIDVPAFIARFGKEAWERRAKEVDELCRAGLLERVGSRLRLTERATMLANEVICRVL